MVLPSNTLHIKQNLILESLILESSMQKSVFQLPQHHIVLDGIQDPGNLGTILRTAAAVGIKNIICLKGTTYPFAPKVLRAAMGAHFHLNIKIGLQYNEFSDFLIEQSNYQSHNIQAYALTLEDAVSFYDVAQTIEKRNRSNHDTHFYWIFGNEGAGVNPQLLTHLENLVHFKKVFIPQSSAVESLNVGIACSVVLYELLRQKIQGANTM
jgi:TrmH family RNA methyltransferase